MMSLFRLMATGLLTLSVTTALADDHTVEPIEAGPQADEVVDELAAQIADRGVRIKRGSRTVCEIWWRKDIPVDPDFKPSPQRLYPFREGQLIGVLHFPRRGSEFRDQTVSSGWYTLRFGLQPIDGNHVGTSLTRDFLLLVQAEQDDLLDDWEVEPLHEASAEAAGSSHPAMLCLQSPGEGTQTALQQDESREWWTLHTAIQVAAGDQSRELPIDLVVVGHATE